MKKLGRWLPCIFLLIVSCNAPLADRTTVTLGIVEYTSEIDSTVTWTELPDSVIGDTAKIDVYWAMRILGVPRGFPSADQLQKRQTASRVLENWELPPSDPEVFKRTSRIPLASSYYVCQFDSLGLLREYQFVEVHALHTNWNAVMLDSSARPIQITNPGIAIFMYYRGENIYRIDVHSYGQFLKRYYLIINE